MRETTQKDRTMALLMDMSVPVQINFGRTRMLLGDLLNLGSGSVIELDRDADEEVEILVNDRVIARGEIVEYEGDYGVRISSLEAAGLDSKSTDPAAVQEEA